MDIGTDAVAKAPDEYHLKIHASIKAVIWKVDPRIRDDVQSGLWLYALENKDKLIDKNKNFLFISFRNRCVELNRKESRWYKSKSSLDELLFETHVFSDNLWNIERIELLSFALLTAQEIKNARIRKFIDTVIRKIWEDERYPIKKAQKAHHLKNLELYRMLRKVRVAYNEVKKNKRRKMPKVRSLEEFKEQLYSGKRIRTT